MSKIDFRAFAAASIDNGGRIKTVQNNSENSTAVTTLNISSHVTETMNTESASKMEQFIKTVTV